MKEQGYIVAIGSVCFDEYYTAPHWVSEGDKCIVEPKGKVSGGMIANAACVLAGYGNKTYFVDVMNPGASNKELLRDLESYGVDTSQVLYNPDMPDAKALIFSTQNDRTIIVVNRGPAELNFSPEQRSFLLGAEYIYTTMSDFGRCRDAIALADELRAGGVKLVFDVEPSTFETGDNPLFERADLLLFNHHGFEKYRGAETKEDCVQRLLRQGAEAVVITLGNKGCCGADNHGEDFVKAIDLPVVDPTGAGDTFNASFLHCHRQQSGLSYALRFASSAANHSVTVMGARGGVGSAERVKEYMNEYYGDT